MNILRAMTTKIVMIALALMAGVGACEAKYTLHVYDVASYDKELIIMGNRFDTRKPCELSIANNDLTISQLKMHVSVLGHTASMNQAQKNIRDSSVSEFFEKDGVTITQKFLPIETAVNGISACDLLPHEFYFRLSNTKKPLEDQFKVTEVLKDSESGNRLELVRYASEKPGPNKCSFRYIGQQMKKLLSKCGNVICCCRNNRVSVEKILEAMSSFEFGIADGLVAHLDQSVQLNALIQEIKRRYNGADRDNILRLVLIQLDSYERSQEFYEVFQCIMTSAPSSKTEFASSSLSLDATLEFKENNCFADGSSSVIEMELSQSDKADNKDGNSKKND